MNSFAVKDDKRQVANAGELKDENRLARRMPSQDGQSADSSVPASGSNAHLELERSLNQSPRMAAQLRMQASLANGRWMTDPLQGTVSRAVPHPVMQLMQSVVAGQGVVQMSRETARIGTELSFTNPALYEAWLPTGAIVTPVTVEVLKSWNEIMQSSSEELGIKTEETNDPIKGQRLRYIFPDGWWYQVSMDAGSIETQVKPFTEGELKTNVGAYIDKFIFGTASQIGLTADRYVGGGHINLDVGSTFDDEAGVFRNFLYLYDRMFRTLKVLDQDENAKSFSELRGGETWPIVAVQMFREGKTTILELANQIRTFLHTRESLEPDFLDRLKNSAVQEYLLANYKEEEIPQVFKRERKKIRFDWLYSKLEGSEQTKLDSLLDYKVQHNQATNVQHIRGEEGDRLELRRFSAQPGLDVLLAEVDLVLGLVDTARSSTLKDIDRMNEKQIHKKVVAINKLLKTQQSDITSKYLK